MEDDDSLSPYEVFQGTAWEAGLLKSILDDNEIEAFIKDVSVLPWNTFPVLSNSAKVFVANKDLESAKEIVKEYYSNMQTEFPENPDEQ
jgi:hypothetical protein